MCKLKSSLACSICWSSDNLVRTNLHCVSTFVIGYTKWRQFCNGVFDDFKVREYVGKDNIESFNDLEEFIETSKLNKLKDVYNKYQCIVTTCYTAALCGMCRGQALKY